MARIDQYTLNQSVPFQQRAISAVIDYILGTIYKECAYDIQTISVSGVPTGGSFPPTGGPLGSNTVVIPWNATPSQVAVAINAVLSIPAGPICFCQGTVLPAGSVVVIWAGTLSQQPQGLMSVAANALTGGTAPNASVAHTVVGVAQDAHPLHSSLANQIVANPSAFMVSRAQMLASDATIQADYMGGTPGTETQITDAHIDAAVASQFNLWSGAY